MGRGRLSAVWRLCVFAAVVSLVLPLSSATQFADAPSENGAAESVSRDEVMSDEELDPTSDEALRRRVAAGELDINMVPWLKERYQTHPHNSRRLSRAMKTLIERRRRGTMQATQSATLDWSVAHPPKMFVHEPHWQGKEMPWEEENRLLDEFHNSQCIVDDERDAYHAACFGENDSFKSCSEECCEAFHMYYDALTTDDCVDGMMDYVPTREIIRQLVMAHKSEMEYHCPHMYHHAPLPQFGEVARRRRAAQEEAERMRREAEERDRVARGEPLQQMPSGQAGVADFGKARMETVRLDDL